MKVFEWDDLRVFLAVLRGRSVRAASKLMGVSHSTVSRRLQAMELQLDAKLFVRQPEGFVPTEVGEAMIERAERVESEILSLEREVFSRDALLSGPIRITAPPPVAQRFLMPLVAEFAVLYPEIVLEIDATFDVADLRRRKADIAIRLQRQPESNLVAHQLPDFASAVYATPEYIAAHTFTGQEPTARWIGWGSEEALVEWRRESPFSSCKLHHHISDSLTQLDAVKAGLGFGFLFCFMGESEPDLVRVPPTNFVRLGWAWVLTHPDLVSTERVRVCVRFLVDAMAKHKRQLQGQVTSS